MFDPLVLFSAGWRRKDVKLYKKVLLETKEGRQLLMDLNNRFGPINSTFSRDPYQTAYNTGRESVIKDINKILGMRAADLIDDIKEIQTQARTERLKKEQLNS